MQPKLILAGSRQQYEKWLDDNGHTSKTAIHGYDRDRIVSVETSEVLVTGTFWSRKDASRLYELARTRVRAPGQ